MYNQDSVAVLEEQLRVLRYKSFDHNDALRLGQLFVEEGKKLDRPTACRIILDDLAVFQYFNQGTNEENNRWMQRKARTVNRMHEPSLLVAAKRELKLLVDEPWLSDDLHYAFVGGGFPLFVNDVFRGIILVSGLPHLRDHKFVSSVIAKDLGVTIKDVPVDQQ